MTRALDCHGQAAGGGADEDAPLPAADGGAGGGAVRCLLLDTLDERARGRGRRVDLTPFIAYPPREAAAYFSALAPDFQLAGAGRGARWAIGWPPCWARPRAMGYEQVAAINSDSPALPPAFLSQAFRELDDPAVDVVLGPCDDGGYYLIGWKRPYPPLVREVRMSTPHVLADTLAVAAAAGLRVALLPPWYDIDDAADLARMRAQGHAGAHTRAFLER